MAKQKKNFYAKLSFIFSLFFWVPALNLFTSVLAIAYGIVGLKEIKINPEPGKALAIFGLSVGILTLILSIVGYIVTQFFPQLIK